MSCYDTPLCSASTVVFLVMEEGLGVLCLFVVTGESCCCVYELSGVCAMVEINRKTFRVARARYWVLHGEVCGV